VTAYLGKILSAIKNNWGKFFVFLFCVMVFLFVLFPLDDLGDFVSAQITKYVPKTYVRFDKMGISLIPQPGVQLKQVYVETGDLPPLAAQELTLTPSMGALLSNKPYGHFSAKGFMKGSVDVKTGSGKRSEAGVDRIQLDVSAENLSLFDMKGLLNLPVVMRGQLSMDLKNGQIDPKFGEQPEMDISMKIEKFDLPAANVQTAMGPITLPEIKIGQILVTGRLYSGRITITEAKIGKEGDEIFGNIKFNMGLTLNMVRDGQNEYFVPTMGNYNAEVDLKVKKSFQDRASLPWFLLDQYKTALPDGSQFRIKISGANFMSNPTIGVLQ
jgi:type II secretion system protein N